MKKCVFENLKGDVFFFLMQLSSCLLVFEAIKDAKLYSLLSSSSVSNLSLSSFQISYLFSPVT